MILLWAQAAEPAKAPRPATFDWGAVWPWAALIIGALVLGSLIIYLADRWRKRPVQERLSANEQLSLYRELYERGELTQEEYDRIRAKLGKHLRQELAPPAPPAPGGPEA